MDQSVVTDPEFVLMESHLTIKKYFRVSCFTVLIVDYFVTLPSEVDLIWSAKWTFAKALYLGARYISFAIVFQIITTFVHLRSFVLCLALDVCIMWTTWLIYIIGQVIFLLRTCALWHKTRWMIIILGFISAVVMGTMLGVDITITATWFNQPSICESSIVRPSLIFLNLGCLLAYETVVGGLTLVKALHDFKEIRGSRTPLLAALYRDGLLFYICNAATSLANILMGTLAPGILFDMIFSMQLVIHSILSVRVILHIREVNRKAPSATEVLGRGISNPPGESAETNADEETNCNSDATILSVSA